MKYFQRLLKVQGDVCRLPKAQNKFLCLTVILQTKAANPPHWEAVTKDCLAFLLKIYLNDELMIHLVSLFLFIETFSSVNISTTQCTDQLRSWLFCKLIPNMHANSCSCLAAKVVGLVRTKVSCFALMSAFVFCVTLPPLSSSSSLSQIDFISSCQPSHTHLSYNKQGNGCESLWLDRLITVYSLI